MGKERGGEGEVGRREKKEKTGSRGKGTAVGRTGRGARRATGEGAGPALRSKQLFCLCFLESCKSRLNWKLLTMILSTEN